MNLSEVYWDPDIPDDVKAVIERHLSPWLMLIPTWCQEFRVRYHPQRDARMASESNYRNRWATLIVTGEWLGETDKERDNAVRHELCHVILEPLTSAIYRIINDTLEEGTAAYKLSYSLFTDGTEAAVEDLARAIGRLR